MKQKYGGHRGVRKVTGETGSQSVSRVREPTGSLWGTYWEQAWDHKGYKSTQSTEQSRLTARRHLQGTHGHNCVGELLH